MIEFVDESPAVEVNPAEFNRLLGYPRHHELTGRALELADAARTWYADQGRPWIYARLAERIELEEEALSIEGVTFVCSHLLQSLRQAGADRVALVAVSAGPEIVQESQQRWNDEKPDEYYFLEVFGSAVVECLTTVAGARLCAWADDHDCAVLPHYSPGYPEWDVREQPRLLELMQATSEKSLLTRLAVLDSGMLQPKKSLLGVFGLTVHTDRVRQFAGLVPCSNCSFDPCQFRRVPFVDWNTALRDPAKLPMESSALLEFISPGDAARGSRPDATTEPSSAPSSSAQYSVSPKVLQKWADTLLSIEVHPDSTVEALFRYPGTTCTNMGRPLEFHYRVALGPRGMGYPIRRQWCGPAPHDTGHTSMCAYLTDARHLMTAIEAERPLHGLPLANVLTWRRPRDMAGCYCQSTSRDHKWGLVLETIHYALAKREEEAVPPRKVS